MIPFFEALRRGWRALILVAIPVLVGVVFYAERLPNKFTATAVVSFAPRPTSAAAQVGADVVTLVLPKYQVYAESDATVARVAQRVGLSRSTVQNDLSITIPNQTSNLELAASDTDPQITSRIANAVATEVVTFSQRDPLLQGTEVQQAVVPTSPSGPPRRLIEGAGAVAALVVGIGIMLLLDRLRPVVRTAPDAADAAGLRLLGSIPRAVIVRTSLPDALSNRRIGPAIRNLRTQIDRVAQRAEQPSHRARILVVTSAIEGQGKTTLATLLALAAARVQQRVLLIDGDLVRPSLDRVFRLAPKPGLAQALRSGGIDSRSFVRNQLVPNLSIMPTTVDAEAGDLLSRQMGGVLHWASESYDRVIVDAAPTLGNDAGPTLATLADDVMVVVRRGVRVSLVEEALAVLRSLEAPLVGVVANTTPVMEQYGYYD